MKQFMVHVQPREPSGIMIWTRDSPLIEMFGIELYVGKHNHSQKEPIWDRQLMVNVTSTVDGKFLIHDRDMIVEVGDTIRYRFLVLHKHTVSHSNYRRILVTDHLFFRPRNTKCFSECLVRDQAGYREEAARMKEILENKILQCVGSQGSELLFFPLEGATKLVSDAMHFIKYRLWQVEDLRPVINSVQTAYVAQNGVGVKMRTVIDKLKVLEFGKGKITVVDYDNYMNVEGLGEGEY
uniref:CBM39 domain-containing protein n=1 Tax=Anopheles darlingi TaxID=43151 RepID=A0A2M4CK39_ANODA